MTKFGKRFGIGAIIPAAIVAVSVVAATTVFAAEVNKIAILVPEEGTDFGWNQHGV